MNARDKDTRLVARVNDDIHQLVMAAAELSGSSISQFLVDAAVSKAREVTDEATRIKLTLRGAERMFAALAEPTSPSDALLVAAKRYKEKNINESYFSANPSGT